MFDKLLKEHRLPTPAGTPNQGHTESAAIWRRLNGPSWECDTRMPWADPLLIAIADIITPTAQVKDTGIAGAVRHGLVERGFLTAHPTDDPNVTEFRRVPKCPAPDTRSHEEIMNANLRKQQDLEAEIIRQDGDNRERVARQQRALDPGRAQLVATLHELGVVTADQVREIVKEAVAEALSDAQIGGH